MPARRALIALGAMTIAMSVAAAAWIAVRNTDRRPTVLGARLGMTPDELRARVDARDVGVWTSSLVGGDWVLDRRAIGSEGRFEFHEGQLVAVRAEGPRSADLPTTPPFEVTPGSVLVRAVDHDRVQITLLSRGCPTHHEEAEALVRAHVSAP